jgi:F-type H+-transporting ATPase subunit delta
MAEGGIVRRYAKALFDVADKQGIVDEIRADLLGLRAVMRASPQLGRVLRAPTIAAEAKRQLVWTAFGGRMNELTLRFLEMAINKEREEILPDVPAAFEHLAYARLNLQPVHVTSAVPLSPQERDALAASLGRRTGKRIELHERVDSALMGGAVVRLGDTIIDGSVQGRLRRLREHLLSPSRDGFAAEATT